MVEFIDGPAEGEVLFLQRAPKLLRVVRGPRGKLDALDLPQDTPAAHESIFLYRLTGESTAMFLDGRGCRGRYAVARYQFVADRPSDRVLRHTELWRQWASENCQRIVAMPEVSHQQCLF
jgi:hypothetical protein